MEQMRYGHIRGLGLTVPCQMTDSETVKIASGRFVSRNTSTGKGEIADTTDTIMGWVDADDYNSAGTATTSSSTYPMYYDFGDVFSIPLAYDNSSYTVNYSQAIFFELCDLYVASSVQYADPTNYSTGQLMIVGGQAATGTTICTSDGYLEVCIGAEQRLTLGVGA